MSKKKEKAEHKKSIWKDADFTKKIATLIDGGILLKGIDALLKELNADTKEQESIISKKVLQPRLDKFVWTAERVKLLKGLVRVGKEDSAYERLPFLPKDMVAAKIREIKGKRVETTELRRASEAGVGRFMVSGEVANMKIVRFKPTSVKNPCVVETKSENSFGLVAIDAPYVGLKYNPVMDENLVRNAFIYAERTHKDVIFLTGGLMYLDVKKAAGYHTLHRGRISGFNFNADIIDPRYRAEAKSIHDRMPPDKVGFYTLREKFLTLCTGWKKIVTDDGRPLFSGKVLILFGRPEEEVIEAAANAEINYITDVMRLEAQSDVTAAELELSHAKAENASREEVDRLRGKLKDAIDREKRLRQQNVGDEYKQYFVDILRSFVINAYKDAIPNCEVISQGSAFCSLAGKIGEIHQDRDEAATDGLLSEFLLNDAGRRSLSQTLPDFVLLASPTSLSTHWGVGERMNKKDREITHIWQLPSALDKDYLRDGLRNVIRKGSPLERLIQHPRFEPGVLSLSYVNGIWRDDVLSATMLTKLNETSKSRKNDNSGYIYIGLTSDNHAGHPWKQFYYDPRERRWVGHEEGFFKILRENFGDDVPLHGMIDPGDDVQGHNFASERQPHPHSGLITEVEEEFGQIRKEAERVGTAAAAMEKLNEIHDKAIEQLLRRGEHWPQRQFKEAFKRMIEPNLDVFLSILKRSRKAGIKFVGVGEALYGRPDSRDIGVVSFIGGDHFGWTIFGQMLESFSFAEKLTDRIEGKSREFSRDELERMIRAPHYGNTPVGWGLVSGPGGYEWGISLRHEALNAGGQNSDRIRTTAHKLLERGDFTRIFGSRHALHISGGIHRYGLVKMPNLTVISCASGTDTDPYGERGWSPNNVGNLVIGLPTKGPDYGPIRLIPFDHVFVRKYLLKPWKIDWDEVFKDAL